MPPEYIISNWTDEMLHLMAEKLVERKERERGKVLTSEMSEEAFFKRAGITYRRMTDGD